MKGYTVKQLARLSGVSVRALHHYDEIGLLKPAFVGENRYRYYGRDELLRLQDILFHRELGVPLAEIAAALEQDGDRLALLEQHRRRLLERVERSRQLITTIDRTIAELKGQDDMKDKELFKGFSPEKQREYEQWMVDRFGASMTERIAQSKARHQAMSPQELRERMEEGKAATDALKEAFLSGAAADDPANDPLLDRHRAWVAGMWDRPCTPEAYGGLAEVYRHPDFLAMFDQAAEGFAAWTLAAIKAYAARKQASGE